MSDGARINVAVAGALGRMGSATCEAVRQDHDLALTAMVDPGLADIALDVLRAALSEDLVSGTDADVTCPSAPGIAGRFVNLEEAIAAGHVDVVVDFTTPAVVRANVFTCLERGVPVVVGTTGLSDSDLAEIGEQAVAHGVPVLVAPNFAVGAVLMMRFAREAAKAMRACEIVELHHDRKLDAPSGTSKLTRSLVEREWREAGFERDVPIHSVRLPGLVAHQEVIFGGLGETLTIRHDSLSRESFMPGVVLAIKRVRGLQGLVVGLENIL